MVVRLTSNQVIGVRFPVSALEGDNSFIAKSIVSLSKLLARFSEEER